MGSDPNGTFFIFATAIAIVAQLVEHWLPKPKVASSRLVYRSKWYHWGLTPMVSFLCGLMLWAQQIVDGFDGIEGAQGNLDEEGVPVTHGAVPEAGQFKGLEFAAVLGLA